MKTRVKNVMLTAMLVVMLTLGAGYAKADFTYIDRGTSRTYPNGIDGDIIVASNAFGSGFIYDLSTNTWTDFALKKDGSSYGTTPYNIGDGYIVGHYAAGGRLYIGFFYNMATGNWSTLDFGNHEETIAFDIDGGKVVGNYGPSTVYQGFIYEIATDTMTTLNTPEGSTYLTGIDMSAGAGGIITASGRVSGIYKSWLYDMDSNTWLPFYGPNGEVQILLYAIDGDYVTGVVGPTQQPFLYNMATDTWTYFKVPGSVGTYPQGIDGNRIVGYFDYYPPDSDPGHGFIYTFNRSPVAICQDVTVEAELGCLADASIDNGSNDPDGDPIKITQTPAGPYPLVTTEVTLTVTDDSGASDTCTARVTVVDTMPPIIVAATVEPQLAAVGQTVSFDGMVGDECGLNVKWDFGDGETSGDLVTTHRYAGAGIYKIVLTVTDSSANWSEEEFMVVVYDPSGGFVSGGGWIWSPEGAFTDDPLATGKASFGFVSSYKKGATIPTGQTEFVYQAGDLNFHSSSYEWLVVTGSNYARFKGTGTINGYGPYKFMLWAGDAPDTFRIKIWWEECKAENVVYDNGMDQAIGGGSIVIHTKT